VSERTVLDPSLARSNDSQVFGIPFGRGARILRDRQGILRAAMDRASGVPAVAAARRLVSVYNGGNMPTQPNYVFLTHPVDLDGAEVEAGTASPNVDTSTTIPVVILWHAPQVGDLLIANAVGGRWVAERGGGCNSTICVTACSSVPVYGAVVEILSGSTVVASCTTGSTGCCTLPVCGTYTVQVTFGGTVQYSASRTLSSGGTTTIALGSSGLVCCGGFMIPQTLTLTDAAGSVSFVYDPNYEFPLWTGGHAVQGLSSTVATPNNVCIVASPNQGPVRVCYQMICNAGTTPKFSVQRSWSWVYQQGTLTPIWYQDPSGFTPGQFCITAPPAICGSPLTDTASFTANPTSSSPFVLSGTPAVASSNATSDPVGGSIAISA
jgi:hypothetical protein